LLDLVVDEPPRICERLTRPAELRFDPSLRLTYLDAQVLGAQHRQPRVRDGVGADLPPHVGEFAEIVP
jgi:hypothetical protein